MRVLAFDEIALDSVTLSMPREVALSRDHTEMVQD